MTYMECIWMNHLSDIVINGVYMDECTVLRPITNAHGNIMSTSCGGIWWGIWGLK